MTLSTAASPWREVESDCLVLDGHGIPRGCDVGSYIYSLHYNEKYFPDSYTFRPERRLPEAPFQDLEFAINAWVPFSAGSRVYLGREIALMEMSDTIALLVC